MNQSTPTFVEMTLSEVLAGSSLPGDRAHPTDPHITQLVVLSFLG